MDSVSIPVAFLAGLISFASPCFLPIVPVFLAYLTGGSTGSSDLGKIPALASAGPAGPDGFISYAEPHAGGPKKPRGQGTTRSRNMMRGRNVMRDQNVMRGRNMMRGQNVMRGRNAVGVSTEVRGPWWGVANAGVFSLGFTAVFMGLWLLISLLGLSVGDYRGVLRVVGGILLILLGLVSLGFFRNFGGGFGSLERMNMAGAPTLHRSSLMGVAFAAAWSPCVGPVLGVILGLAMVRGSMGVGMLLLFAYCAGLALPLLLMAAGVSGLQERLSWFSRHGRTITVVAGILLIVIGFLLATDLLAPLSNVSLGGI